MEDSWKTWTRHVSCPCCGGGGGFTRHGSYTKYHYRRRLELLRLRCRVCGKTHALIPEFSLPGTSLGTAEVEQFVRERTAGASRRVAGRELHEQGVAFEYLRRIERMIITAIHRAKALFAAVAPQVGGVYRWLIAAAANETRRLVTLNKKSIAAGYGAVFCSLAPRAGRQRKSSGITISHNKVSAAGRRSVLHSG